MVPTPTVSSLFNTSRYIWLSKLSDYFGRTFFWLIHLSVQSLSFSDHEWSQRTSMMVLPDMIQTGNHENTMVEDLSNVVHQMWTQSRGDSSNTAGSQAWKKPPPNSLQARFCDLNSAAIGMACKTMEQLIFLSELLPNQFTDTLEEWQTSTGQILWQDAAK